MFWSEFRQLLKETGVRCCFTEGMTEPDDDAWVTVSTEHEEDFWERLDDDCEKGQTLTVHLRADAVWSPVGEVYLDRDARVRWNNWHIRKIDVMRVVGQGGIAIDYVSEFPELASWLRAVKDNYGKHIATNPTFAIHLNDLRLFNKDQKHHLDGSSWAALFSEDSFSVEEFHRGFEAETSSPAEEGDTNG